ncbi:M24 family metallopeptidase [Halegenticoccus tardaugens]|uniref:M24 family metallopeptidase n=1 Tax=Halegenticoccus tardaugens TaxID=2071624 RepID=UPI00100B5F56|nr:M24 family metallopeptidase [Halegenticoccus tardaugens]
MTDERSADLPPGYDALADELAARGATAFVHVGDRFDADVRYLTSLSGFDGECAVVFADGRRVVSVPARARVEAERVVGGSVRAHDADAPAGRRAAEILSEALGRPPGGTVLVPRRIPHDAAVYLERAGYDVASTSALAAARTTKTDAERDRIRRVQRVAIRAMARAEETLAASTPRDGALVWDGGPLSTERLRRRANAVLAAHGAGGAGNTVVSVGPRGDGGPPAAVERTPAAVERPPDAVELRPGETVTVRLAPRGPRGYHGFLARTFVVAGDGGWERRAHVAAEAALNAGLAALEAGAPACDVREEVLAEVAAYGFDVGGPTSVVVGDAGHGVGLARREPPALADETPIEAGAVLAVTPTIGDSGEGTVALADLAVVTDDGFELLGERSRSIVPCSRSS